MEGATEGVAARFACSQCGTLRPSADFYTSRGRRQPWCKPCYSAYHRARNADPGRKALIATRSHRHAQRCREIIASRKGQPCADCGRRQPPEAMDFDHVRGRKRFSPRAAKSHSVGALLAELAKCDVVCAACHRVRTASRRPARGSRAPSWLRKRGLIDAAKDVPCVDCGERFHPEAMDLDHVRGTKLFNLAAMRGRSVEAVRVELTKCDAVCANCHRVRTRQRKQYLAGRPQKTLQLVLTV